jgi:hypothetical protein
VDEIKELKREGLSIRAISRLTGFDRKTIKRFLLAPSGRPVYGPRPAPASKLEPFKPYLKERLQAGVWNAQVLMRELRERNYTGCYSILTDWLRPQRRIRRQKPPSLESAYLFPDLSQCMLKTLLAPFIPEDLLRAPRGEYRNASELAAAADVSVMSAFRFVRQLRQDGFLDESQEQLRRWQAAHLRGAPELPRRWIIPAKSGRQLPAALHKLGICLVIAPPG